MSIFFSQFIWGLMASRTMRQRVSAVLTFHSVVTCYDCHESSFTIRHCHDSEGMQGWRICVAPRLQPSGRGLGGLALDTGNQAAILHVGAALQGVPVNTSPLGLPAPQL